MDEMPRTCTFFCSQNQQHFIDFLASKGQIRPQGKTRIFLAAEGQLKMGVERNDD